MIIGGGIYVVMCLLLSWLARYLESRNRRSGRRPAVPVPPELPEAA
jgi:hypothetical protein